MKKERKRKSVRERERENKMIESERRDLFFTIIYIIGKHLYTGTHIYTRRDSTKVYKYSRTGALRFKYKNDKRTQSNCLVFYARLMKVSRK